MRSSVLVSVTVMGMVSFAAAFQAPGGAILRTRAAPSLSLRAPSSAPRAFNRAAGVKMAVLLDNGELKLDSEECAKLKLPADSVIPADSAEEIQGRLQEFEDEEVRKLFRGLGPSPDEEPYEGYWADVERLGLEESNLGTSSINPGSLYGPDGVPYAPWMVGKVSEGRTKKRPSTKTEEELKFEYDGRGQELAGAGGGGLNSQLVGDEVKLSFNIGTETNTRGYVITRRPGGSDDSAYKVVADYLTPGASLNSGAIRGEYSYVDGSVEPGTWVYRVADEDMEGRKTILSQTIIEVPSNSDKVKTLVSAAVLGAFLTGLTLFAINADPMNGL
ncbi:hypothetical protein T484DRAFT_1930759 [Baffinella frigidus]|nr:hypothetical protein T484DRAFT_1930759 [Cryptophyta sp. CCMP2293]